MEIFGKDQQQQPLHPLGSNLQDTQDELNMQLHHHDLIKDSFSLSLYIYMYIYVCVRVSVSCVCVYTHVYTVCFYTKHTHIFNLTQNFFSKPNALT